MLPDRVAALIIKDMKLLMVTGYDESFYWTPGGKINDNENHETCLKRELAEEPGVELVSMKHYTTFILPNEATGGEQVNY